MILKIQHRTVLRTLQETVHRTTHRITHRTIPEIHQRIVQEIHQKTVQRIADNSCPLFERKTGCGSAAGFLVTFYSKRCYIVVNI